jgi:hypothetical protein
MKHETATRGSGGRPRKFNEPSGPVTVTLPDRTLGQLQTIDKDRAKAIVKAVDNLIGRETARVPRAEVVEMAPGTGIVVIPLIHTLRHIPWLKMIEVAPARYLLTVAPGTPIEKLEIALIDLAEDARVSAPEEVTLLQALRGTFSQLRRRDRISMAEILVVVM